MTFEIGNKIACKNNICIWCRKEIIGRKENAIFCCKSHKTIWYLRLKEYRERRKKGIKKHVKQPTRKKKNSFYMKMEEMK